MFIYTGREIIGVNPDEIKDFRVKENYSLRSEVYDLIMTTKEEEIVLYQAESRGEAMAVLERISEKLNSLSVI